MTILGSYSRRWYRLVASTIAMVVVLSAPSISFAQAIATVKLTSGAATFGLVVPKGAARSGLRIGNLPTQVDVKNRWADGSIRFAVLSAIVPSSGNYGITDGPASDGTLQRVWPSVAVRFVVTGGGPTGTFVATLPAATDGDAWLAGPVVRENRVTVVPLNGSTPHPFLRVVFDIRTYSTGQHRVDVTAQNVLHDAGETVPYDVTITVNGQTVFSKNGFKHFYLSRWRKEFPANSLVESDVTPDFTPFIAAKALPEYDSSITNIVDDPESPERKPFFEIGQRGGVTQNGMPAAGGRIELAPYPDWVARYIVHRNPTVKQYLLRTDDLAASWPVHVADNLGRIIRTDRAPGSSGYWIDPRPEAGYKPAGNFQDPERILYPDTAHCPSFGYVSYLLTGTRYYLDELKFWANYAFLGTYPGNPWYPRDDKHRQERLPTSLDHLMIYGEIRAMAWGLRNVVDAASYVPDADSEQSYFRMIAGNNLERLDMEASRGGTQWPAAPFDGVWVGKGQSGAAGEPLVVYANLWQVGMTVWAVDHAIDQGLWGSRGLEYRQRAASMVTRTFNADADGFPRWAVNYPYHIYGEFVGPSEPYSVRWYTDFGQVFRKTKEMVGDVRYPFAGWHGLEFYVALNAAEGAGIPVARAAMDYLIGERDADTANMNEYLRTRPGWMIKRGTMGKGNGGTDVSSTKTPSAPTGVRIVP